MPEHLYPSETEAFKRGQAPTDGRISGPTGAAPRFAPGLRTPGALLHLQRQAGNSAVSQLMGEGTKAPTESTEEVVEAGTEEVVDTGGVKRIQRFTAPDPPLLHGTDGTVQRKPNEYTVEPGVTTGGKKSLKGDDTVFYEWNWPVVFNGDAYLYNDWVDTNDMSLEPALREDVKDRLASGAGKANLQGFT